MKAIVRDDIIALETFVALRFKYEEYAYMLHEAGGYCFIDQFVQHFGGENKGRYLAKQLEENGIISTRSFNNYKYCYLTDAAIKYLTYKDDPRDFSEMKKANIPVKKISPAPTDKVLFSSALKFALIQEYKWVGKQDFVKMTNITFEKIFRNIRNKEEQVRICVNKTISYYDKSKIIFAITNNLTLKMIVLLTGSKKFPKGYMIALKDYISTINVQFSEIQIFLVGTSESETNELKTKLEEFAEDRNRKEDAIRKKYPMTSTPKPTGFLDPLELDQYRRLVENERIRNDNNKYAIEKEIEKLNKETFKFKVGIMKTGFYMEHYTDRIGGTNYIKPKDQNRFEQLKESLKSK